MNAPPPAALREALRQRPRPSARRRPPEPKSASGVERTALAAIKRRVIAPAVALVRRRLPARLAELAPYAMRHDADVTIAEQIVGGLVIEYRDLVLPSTPHAIATNMVEATDHLQRETLKGQLSFAFGMPPAAAPRVLKAVREARGVDPIGAEPWLKGVLHEAVERNVALIQSIPRKFFDDLAADLQQGFQAGVRVEDLEKMVAENYLRDGGSATKRASVIARDQIGKLRGDLDKARMTDLGVESYIWRTALDERVRGNPGGRYPSARPSHWAREGKRFAWNAPPEGGHPGEAVLCRCYAEPIIPGMEDLLGQDPDAQRR